MLKDAHVVLYIESHVILFYHTIRLIKKQSGGCLQSAIRVTLSSIQ